MLVVNSPFFSFLGIGFSCFFFRWYLRFGFDGGGFSLIWYLEGDSIESRCSVRVVDTSESEMKESLHLYSFEMTTAAELV